MDRSRLFLKRADHRRDYNRHRREKVCPDIDQPS
jgi:hypothetical protein